jgi:hypothetical protein
MTTKTRRIERDQASILWHAIRDAKVAYNAMQEALGTEDQDCRETAIHNHDVTEDILYESFVRLLGFDPHTFD